MQIIPKANTLRKSVLLYRGIRYRRGYGVHSPFVFNLITKVIEERCSYYSFYDIELIRKQLLFRDNIITYPDRQQKGILHRRTIGEIVEREAIKPKHGALLFRLANYFKSQNILQLGPSMGLSTLYLTSYAPGHIKSCFPRHWKTWGKSILYFLIHYMNNITTFGCLMNVQSISITIRSLFLKESRQAVR